MSLLEAIILGLVQGITEFLPISSTAHLRIVPALVGWKDPGAAFSAVIQLGTVAAVLIYFGRDLAKLTRAFVTGLLERKPFGTVDSRLAWYVAIGSVPAVLMGALFKKAIETSLRSLYVISFSMIALAVVLFFVERHSTRNRPLDEMKLKDGVVIGLWQTLALIPGSSRSGTTLTGGLFLGLTREAAARFSFLLSIPITTAAGVFELKHLLEADPAHSPGMLALVVGTAVSFVSGLAAIAGLLKLLRTRSLLGFVIYRIALGLLLVGLLRTGVLQP